MPDSFRSDRHTLLLRGMHLPITWDFSENCDPFSNEVRGGYDLCLNIGWVARFL